MATICALRKCPIDGKLVKIFLVKGMRIQRSVLLTSKGHLRPCRIPTAAAVITFRKATSACYACFMFRRALFALTIEQI